MRHYIATIESGAVRGVQYCTSVVTDPMHPEYWKDAPDAEILVGVYSGDEATVRRQAAADAGTSPYNIKTIEI